MSKYIIEIPDDVQYVLLNGKADNKYYTAVHPIAELEELNSDYINEHYGSLQDEAYQAGLNDAWEAARKIILNCENGGVSGVVLREVFDTRNTYKVINDNTASEAIAKLKAYEDKQKEDDSIKVGDEVIAPFGKAIVTAFHNNFVNYLYSSGGCGCTEPGNLTKTGKHYDIASILEAMRE